MNEIILIGGSTSKKDRIQQRERYKMPPIGLLALSSLLKMHGYKVNICDLYLEDFSRKEFVEYLQSLSKSPLMIGVSVYTESEKECLEICSIVKKAFNKTKVVMGGPQATFAYKKLMDNEYVDFIIRGEGESKIIPLLEHIKNPNIFPIQNVPGIAWKKEEDGHRIIDLTENTPMINNLDVLPFPDYEEWKPSIKNCSHILTIVTSRGCPSSCIFCSSKALSGSKYRFNSSEWVFSMIVHFYKIYKFNSIAFFDDTLLANKARAKRICNYLISYADKKSFSWACKSRVDMINEEMISIMKNAGCGSIHFGIESISQKILDRMGKRVKIETIFRALRLTKKYGIRPDCSFIIGLPDENLETIEETLLFADVIEKEGFGASAIGITTPFPGTEICENPEKFGLNIKIKDVSKYNLNTPICELEGVTLNDLRKAYFFFTHQRHETNNPNLAGRTSEEIKKIRQDFTNCLKGEV